MSYTIEKCLSSRAKNIFPKQLQHIELLSLITNTSRNEKGPKFPHPLYLDLETSAALFMRLQLICFKNKKPHFQNFSHSKRSLSI